MSTENKEEPSQPPQAQPTLEQILARLAENDAKLAKENDENRNAINTLTKAIVELNKKIEANPSSGKSEGSDIVKVLGDLLNPKGGSLADFAKQAEAFARTADAIEHFRRPSRLGVGEAMLMRLGMRSAFPRYMTKAEIQKAEKMLGVWEELEEAEGEQHPE